MAFTFGFYNSIDHDRVYNAEQMSSLFNGIINDGVFQSIGDWFATSPGTGMQVIVGTGRAWFNGTWNDNDKPLSLNLAASDIAQGRIDAVVLEVNETTRTNEVKIVTGTPALSPVRPTLTNTALVHQHPLAYIDVNAEASSITAANIQVVVGTTDCPFITAILQTTDLTPVYERWEDEFNQWFDSLKEQLSDNVVTNLQGQINALDEELDSFKSDVNNDVLFKSDEAPDSMVIRGGYAGYYISPKTSDLFVLGSLIDERDHGRADHYRRMYISLKENYHGRKYFMPISPNNYTYLMTSPNSTVLILDRNSSYVVTKRLGDMPSTDSSGYFPGLDRISISELPSNGYGYKLRNLFSYSTYYNVKDTNATPYINFYPIDSTLAYAYACSYTNSLNNGTCLMITVNGIYAHEYVSYSGEGYRGLCSNSLGAYFYYHNGTSGTIYFHPNTIGNSSYHATKSATFPLSGADYVISNTAFGCKNYDFYMLAYSKSTKQLFIYKITHNSSTSTPTFSRVCVSDIMSNLSVYDWKICHCFQQSGKIYFSLSNGSSGQYHTPFYIFNPSDSTLTSTNPSVNTRNNSYFVEGHFVGRVGDCMVYYYNKSNVIKMVKYNIETAEFSTTSVTLSIPYEVYNLQTNLKTFVPPTPTRDLSPQKFAEHSIMYGLDDTEIGAKHWAFLGNSILDTSTGKLYPLYGKHIPEMYSSNSVATDAGYVFADDIEVHFAQNAYIEASTLIWKSSFWSGTSNDSIIYNADLRSYDIYTDYVRWG